MASLGESHVLTGFVSGLISLKTTKAVLAGTYVSLHYLMYFVDPFHLKASVGIGTCRQRETIKNGQVAWVYKIQTASQRVQRASHMIHLLISDFKRKCLQRLIP